MISTENQQLIADNAQAPADQIIQAIFRHFTNVRDDADNTLFETVEEALDMWYSVDELILVFDRKTTEPKDGYCDYFIRLIHQYHSGRPHIEDLVDYTASLDKSKLGPFLCEDHYNGVYR